MECVTVDQFKVLVKSMKAVYAKPDFIPDEDAFKVWYALLRDLDYKVLSSAIQKYMQSKTFPPTPADIRTEAAVFRVREYEEMNEMQAWGLVRKAIARSGYYSEEEFQKLPEIARKAVGNSGNLKEWALMPTETVESVIQSNFMRNYRTELQRAKDKDKLSPALAQKMEEYARLSRIGSSDHRIPSIDNKDETGRETEHETSDHAYVDGILNTFREKLKK